MEEHDAHNFEGSSSNLLPATRTCRVCKEIKVLDLMAKDTKSKDKRKNICKSCDAARMRIYFLNKPEKYEENKNIPRVTRPNWKRHNITEEEYKDKLEEQEGLCATCRVGPAECIDHDHNCCSGSYACTNCFRGLLCNRCNSSLGQIKDNLETLSNMIRYLTKYQGRGTGVHRCL